jgi:hypothetical protein
MTQTPLRRAFCGLVAVLVHVSTAHGQPGELIDRVLAVAAGDVIMLSDVRAAQDFGLVEVSSTTDLVGAVLSRLIERALILDEVDRYSPPEPPPDAIEVALGAARARFATGNAFDAALARAGLDEQRLRALLRQNLRVQAYLGQRFSADSLERRQSMIDDWVAGLRRRADIMDLYSPRAPQ